MDDVCTTGWSAAEVFRERVRIDGRRGALAGELCYPPGETRFACLLISPHPHMGGRMENNVIAHLAGSLAADGGVTLRFDYAGVGTSEGARIDVAKSMSVFWATGRAPEDPLMIQDARSAMDWLARQCDRPLVLIGYSFGAYAATRLVDARSGAAGLVMISPTLDRHDFSAAADRAMPKLVVYGDEDFATSRAAVERWVGSLRGPKTVKYVPGGEHFFKGREEVIAGACREFVARVSGSEARPSDADRGLFAGFGW